MATSREITAWFHKENEYNFTPANFTAIVIRLFKQSVKRFRLSLDVSEEQFTKAMVDAVCTFYLAKQKFRSVHGPQRNFYVPNKWSQICEDCWQDMLLHSFFTLDYWDNFWKCYEFGKMPTFFYDIQPFLTGVLPMYVRRSADKLVDNKYLSIDEDNSYVRFLTRDSDDEEDDFDFHYMKSKKQRKLQNDMSN